MGSLAYKEMIAPEIFEAQGLGEESENFSYTLELALFYGIAVRAMLKNKELETNADRNGEGSLKELEDPLRGMVVLFDLPFYTLEECRQRVSENMREFTKLLSKHIKLES